MVQHEVPSLIGGRVEGSAQCIPTAQPMPKLFANPKLDFVDVSRTWEFLKMILCVHNPMWWFP